MQSNISYREFKCLFTLCKHTAVVDSVAISPDGKTMASCSREDFIYLWDLETGAYQKTFAEDEDIYTNLLSVCFSSDGETLVSIRPAVVEIWNLNSGTLRQIIPTPLREVAISLTARKIISFGRQKMSVIDLDQGTVRSIVESCEDVSQVAIHPSGKNFVSGERDGSIKVWDLNTGQFQLSLNTNSEVKGGYFSALTFSPDGQLLASSRNYMQDRDTSDVLKIWDFEKAQCKLSLKSSSTIMSATFSSDGKAIIAGCRNGTIQVWDLETGSSKALIGHTSPVVALAISPNCQRIASGGYDGVVKIWGIPEVIKQER
jgi:WD40 repeat protein